MYLQINNDRRLYLRIYVVTILSPDITIIFLETCLAYELSLVIVDVFFFYNRKNVHHTIVKYNPCTYIHTYT